MRISLRCIVAMVFAVCCSMAFADAIPDRLGTPIDLSSFSGMDSVLDEALQALDTDATPIVPVDSRGHAVWIRPYVTGIVGASFGTINAGGSTRYGGPSTFLQSVGSVNETMFIGGGAIGMAIDRPSGLLRVEVEGRAREPMSGQTNLRNFYNGVPDGDSPLTTTATNGWSAMVNFWRDYFFTDRLGVYGGGGFGIGGYQYSMLGQFDATTSLIGSSAVNTFAWQVGTGITYQLNDRITLDTGYRFLAMTPGATPLAATDGGPTLSPVGSFTSAFSASELLISIRIYEPFRRWR